MKVYKLLHDYNHSGDPEKDGFLLKYEGWRFLESQLLNPRIAIEKMPTNIFFQSNFDLIPKYDYPVTDVGISIMSQRMFQLLEEIGNIDCDKFPVTMLDDTYLGGIKTVDGKIKEDVPRIESYLALRIREFQKDVFDYDNSDYKISRRFEGKINRIKKICLKEPKNGFPPLFRILETVSTLFITQEAKEALEFNNIKGCVFEEVGVTTNIS